MEIVPQQNNVMPSTIGQLIAPEPEDVNGGDVWRAAFRQENDVLNLVNHLTRPVFQLDRNFNSIEQLKLDSLGVDFGENLARAQSLEEYNFIRSQVVQEQADKTTLASGGWTGFIAAAAAGIISPTSLIPFTGQAKGLKGLAQTFSLAAGAVTAQEAVLFGLQETRTPEEAAFSIAAGTALGGLLGTAVKFMTPGEFKAAADSMAASPGQVAILHTDASGAVSRVEAAGAQVTEAPGRRLARADTAVGKAVDKVLGPLSRRLEDSDIPLAPTLGRVIGGINDPIGVLKQLNPITRLQDNPHFESVRRNIAKISGSNLRLEGGVMDEFGTPIQPNAVAGTAFNRARQQQRFFVDGVKGNSDAYARHVLGEVPEAKLKWVWLQKVRGAIGQVPEGKLDWTDFSDEVFLKYQRGETSPDAGIQQAIDTLDKYYRGMDDVATEAFEFRKAIDGVYAANDEMIDFLDDGFEGPLSPNEGEVGGVRPLYTRQEFDEEGEIQKYLNHVYNTQKMQARSGEFIEDFTRLNKEKYESSFKKSFKQFSKLKDKLASLKNILKKDEAALNAYAGGVELQIKQLDEKYGGALQQVKNLRKAMREAGAEKADIDAAAKEVEDTFGSEYADAMKLRKELDKERRVLNKAGAGMTEKQQKIIDEIDKTEQMQLDELLRVSNAGAKLSAKLRSIGEKAARPDKEFNTLWTRFQKAVTKHLDLQRKVDKLAKSEDVEKFDLAVTNQVAGEDRMVAAFERLEKHKEYDAEAFARFEKEAHVALLEKVRDLNNKRAYREVKLQEKAAKLDPASKAEFRAKELEETTRKLDKLEDTFDTRWRARGAIGQPLKGAVDFTEQANTDAKLLYHTLVGQPMRVSGLAVLREKRGMELQRMLNVPLEIKMKYLETDPELLMRAHNHTLAPDVELYRMFGSVNAQSVFDELEQDWLRARDALGDRNVPGYEKKAKKLEKAYKQAVEDFTVVINRMRNDRGTSDSAGARLGQMALSANVFTKMGMVVVSSVSDLARPIFLSAVNGVFKSAWKPLLTDLSRVKMTGAEGRRFGLINDIVLHSRSQSVLDLVNPMSSSHTRPEKVIHWLGNNTGLAALFDFWTAGNKQLAGMTVFAEMSHAIRVVANPAEFSAKEIKKARDLLQVSSVGDEMAGRIWDQFLKPGGSTEFSDGFRLSNIDAWDDYDASMAYRSAVSGMVDNLIITPGLDRPSWVDENMAYRLLAQFKSFTFTSTTRVMMAGLQRPDMAYLQGSMMSLALGALSYYTYAVSVGGETYNEMLEANSDKWLTEALNRSGLLGILSEVQNVGEQIPALQDMAFFGGRETPERRSQSMLGAILGPTYGLADNIIRFGQGVNEPTDGTLRALRTLLPYQNMFLTRQLLDKLEKNLATYLPDRRN